MAQHSFDYSKWDHIELSDDESDLHPNIDKESWFRMKHRTRLEREQKEDAEIVEHEKLTQEDNIRLKVLHTRINRIKKGQVTDDEDEEDLEALQGEVDDLMARIAQRDKRKKEIMDRRAWNIDNICKTKEEKSLLSSGTATSLVAEQYDEPEEAENDETRGCVEEAESRGASAGTTTATAAVAVVGDKAKKAHKETPAKTAASTATKTSVAGPVDPNKREKFSAMSYNDFAVKHEQLLERYSEIGMLDETRDFLFKHCDILLHEHAQSYMLLSSLEDQMNGKFDRAKLVCRQSQILSHIHELGTSMKRDPRDVILPFFARINDAHYMKGFLEAVADFAKRIAERAIIKRREMDAERNGTPRLGPGGLDPLEVLQMLPPDLQDAFDSQNIDKLHSVLAAMDPAEAKRCMKLCVDGGLWVPQDENVFENESDFPADEDDEKK